MSEAQKLHESMRTWREILNQPPIPTWEALPPMDKVVLERALDEVVESLNSRIMDLKQQLARR